jgi:hypothetical protein
MSDEKRTTIEKREYDNGDTEKVVREEKGTTSPRNLPTENASTAGEGPDADTTRTTITRKEERIEEHDED